MRLRVQWSLRALLIVVAMTVMVLGAVLGPFLRQRQYFVWLRERDVFVYAEPVGPSWLRTPVVDDLIARPMQVQVLVRPADSGQIRVLGESISYADARAQLGELERRLGVRPILVSDGRGLPSASEIELARMAMDLETIVTPCGIGNFRNE